MGPCLVPCFPMYCAYKGLEAGTHLQHLLQMYEEILLATLSPTLSESGLPPAGDRYGKNACLSSATPALTPVQHSQCSQSTFYPAIRTASCRGQAVCVMLFFAIMRQTMQIIPQKCAGIFKLNLLCAPLVSLSHKHLSG